VPGKTLVMCWRAAQTDRGRRRLLGGVCWFTGSPLHFDLDRNDGDLLRSMSPGEGADGHWRPQKETVLADELFPCLGMPGLRSRTRLWISAADLAVSVCLLEVTDVMKPTPSRTEVSSLGCAAQVNEHLE